MGQNVSKADQDAARESLRQIFPAGSTVATIVLHVSDSGMSRAIAVIGIDDTAAPENVSGLVARAIGWRLHPRRGGVNVQGAGVDMSFHLVYTLAQVLHGDGYALVHRSLGR